MIAAQVLWRFGKKYWHTATEIPLMYAGELSHMEHTRRWSLANALYTVLLCGFNALDAMENYWVLRCITPSENDKNNFCANYEPGWKVVTEVLAQVMDTVIPAILLYKALKVMRESQEDSLKF